MKEHNSSTSRGAAVVAHLQVLHAGRDPARLAMKYLAMRRSFGDFIRGTCSLFYLRASGVEMPPSPSIWICGDVHLGNFGIYEAEDARLRFDLNDFDEAGGPFLSRTAQARSGHTQIDFLAMLRARACPNVRFSPPGQRTGCSWRLAIEVKGLRVEPASEHLRSAPRQPRAIYW